MANGPSRCSHVRHLIGTNVEREGKSGKDCTTSPGRGRRGGVLPWCWIDGEDNREKVLGRTAPPRELHMPGAEWMSFAAWSLSDLSLYDVYLSHLLQPPQEFTLTDQQFGANFIEAMLPVQESLQFRVPSSPPPLLAPYPAQG